MTIVNRPTSTFTGGSRNMLRNNASRAFHLVEILIVVVILVCLALLVIPQFMNPMPNQIKVSGLVVPTDVGKDEAKLGAVIVVKEKIMGSTGPIFPGIYVLSQHRSDGGFYASFYAPGITGDAFITQADIDAAADHFDFQVAHCNDPNRDLIIQDMVRKSRR